MFEVIGVDLGVQSAMCILSSNLVQYGSIDSEIELFSSSIMIPMKSIGVSTVRKTGSLHSNLSESDFKKSLIA